MTSRISQTQVSYSAQQMYDLVSDVGRYPEFLPWCVALRVTDRRAYNDTIVVTSDMVVSYKVFREKFRSRASMTPSTRSIDVEYVDGPFRHLRNSWRFTDLPTSGSLVDFEIDFEFRNILLQATAQSVFEKAFLRMSEAFVARADDVYQNTITGA